MDGSPGQIVNLLKIKRLLEDLKGKPCPSLVQGVPKTIEVVRDSVELTGVFVTPKTSSPGALCDHAIPIILDDPCGCLDEIPDETKLRVRYQVNGHNLHFDTNGYNVEVVSTPIGSRSPGAMLVGQSSSNTYDNALNFGQGIGGVGVSPGQADDSVNDRFIDFDIPLAELKIGVALRTCAFGGSTSTAIESMSGFSVKLINDFNALGCNCDSRCCKPENPEISVPVLGSGEGEPIRDVAERTAGVTDEFTDTELRRYVVESQRRTGEVLAEFREKQGVVIPEPELPELTRSTRIEWNHNRDGGTSNDGAIGDGGCVTQANEIAFGPGVEFTGSNFEWVLSGIDTESKEDAIAADDYVEFAFMTGNSESQLSNWFQGLEPQPNSTGAGNYDFCLQISSDGFESSRVLIPDGHMNDPQTGGDNGPGTRVNLFLPLQEQLEPNTVYILRYYIWSARESGADGSARIPNSDFALPAGSVSIDDVFITVECTDPLEEEDEPSEGEGIAATLPPAGRKLVFDNNQDGQNNSPFNVQVRNTTSQTINIEILLTDKPYSSIPNLNLPEGVNLEGPTLNSNGLHDYLFTGTLEQFARYEITGGLPDPPGPGVGSSELFCEVAQ